MCEEAEDGEAVIYRDDDDVWGLVYPMIEWPLMFLLAGQNIRKVRFTSLQGFRKYTPNKHQ